MARVLKGLAFAAVAAAAAGAVSMAAGCESGGAASGIGDSLTSIKSLAGDWVLQQIEGVDAASLLPQGSKLPDLKVGEDGKVSGFGGVNRLMSSLDLDKLTTGEFSLSPVGRTMMAGPDEAMKLEDRYSNLLGQVTGFNLDGGNLNLTKGAETLLKFVRAG